MMYTRLALANCWRCSGVRRSPWGSSPGGTRQTTVAADCTRVRVRSHNTPSAATITSAPVAPALVASVAPERGRQPTTSPIANPVSMAPPTRTAARWVGGAGLAKTGAMALVVSNLSVSRGAARALEGVSFCLEPGSLTALVGPNGAGKSTLLQAIAGQLPLAAGTVTVAGQPLDLQRARRLLALMPQRGEIAWDFPISVRELVGLGRLVATRPGCCDVEAALQRVGLEAVAHRRLDQLSGGQQQRALLARTLVQPAQILLLDEPCAAIDPPSRTALLAVMGQLRDAGLTLLVSSHDWGRDLDAYDRVLVLDRHLLADGSPGDVRQSLGELRVGNHCCG